ncbi:hypothetical protein PsalMR5_00266 [Piscirickettsia salmonis]|uniref:hypothetical protein n=1 Tax=Piscirickettsia salmonis TaxID=1238 RepID=UPI0012BB192B|nr:hypothetical protein [Piscirickettsia salmonis]QGP52869.1 hypothetical protein PsalSR1_00262 [Piscirickettsia salmonis]QGP61206.1 hypothetical protein PsalBI1_03841 [Piscirickettsia salmonis]QGP62441.1 hypothetical protein PsalMR5_00266 [Piscirickettsia salmonis]
MDKQEASVGLEQKTLEDDGDPVRLREILYLLESHQQELSEVLHAALELQLKDALMEEEVDEYGPLSAQKQELGLVFAEDYYSDDCSSKSLEQEGSARLIDFEWIKIDMAGEAEPAATGRAVMDEGGEFELVGQIPQSASLFQERHNAVDQQSSASNMSQSYPQ